MLFTLPQTAITHLHLKSTYVSHIIKPLKISFPEVTEMTANPLRGWEAITHPSDQILTVQLKEIARTSSHFILNVYEDKRPMKVFFSINS